VLWLGLAAGWALGSGVGASDAWPSSAANRGDGAHWIVPVDCALVTAAPPVTVTRTD
jgi:hypothetical protein